MSSQYPKDEFDRAGEDMPIGVHRQEPSKWKNVWPFLVILVVVPLLAWGATTLLTQRNATNTASQSASSTVTQNQSQSDRQQSEEKAQSAAEENQVAPAVPEPAPQAETPQEPSQSETVSYNAAISVLNGTGTSGWAAENVATLANAGFAGATAANASGWETEISTVYYEDPQMAGTAQAVAQTLGINNVQQTTGLGNPDVVVILR